MVSLRALGGLLCHSLSNMWQILLFYMVPVARNDSFPGKSYLATVNTLIVECLNSEFSFSTGLPPKKTSLLCYPSIGGGDRTRFRTLQKEIVQSETQTALYWIWTRLGESISYAKHISLLPLQSGKVLKKERRDSVKLKRYKDRNSTLEENLLEINGFSPLDGWLVGFYGISTFAGYLMPNPF